MSLLGLVPGLGWLRAGAKLAGRVFGPIWRWLTADWRNGPLAVFALLVLAHTLVIDPDLRKQRDAAVLAHKAERAAHDETIRGVVTASRAAEAAQTANITRAASEQAEITERITDEFQGRIEALRARAARLRDNGLRAEAAPAAGLSGAASLPGAGRAAGPADEAPGGGGFPAACPVMDLEQRVTASEQALQLDALIDWNLAQAQVSTSPGIEAAP